MRKYAAVHLRQRGEKKKKKEASLSAERRVNHILRTRFGACLRCGGAGRFAADARFVYEVMANRTLPGRGMGGLRRGASAKATPLSTE